MVADAGLEPASPKRREILSLVCIPIPPISHNTIIARQTPVVNHYEGIKCQIGVQSGAISSSKKNRLFPSIHKTV
jgi:hypothetical protein